MRHPVTGFLVLAGSIFAADQLIKHHIEKQPAEQFPKKMKKIPATLHRSHNRGIFMNLLENHPKAASILSTGALGLFSVSYLPALWKKCSVFYMAGAALITGGALSNVYDHIKKGSVTDYFSLPLKPIRHVIFNIGDISIFAGLALLLGSRLRQN